MKLTLRTCPSLKKNYKLHSTMRKTAVVTDVEYCRDLVKQYDFCNYLSCLLVPKKYQSAFFVLRAFNVEIATIKEQVNNNALTGRIRFQWWRDAIEEIYASKRKTLGTLTLKSQIEFDSRIKAQPVVRALQALITDYNLSHRWFERTIEARQKDLAGEQPETLSELEDYGENGHSSLLYLMLECMDIHDEKTEYAASHVGVCSGVTTLLQGFCVHVSKKEKICFPKETLIKAQLSQDVLFRGPPNNAEDEKCLQNAIFDIASQAFGHLEKARSLTHEISPHAVYALLPAVKASMYLEELRLADFNPYKLQHQNNHLWLQVNLMKTKLTGKF